MFSIEVKKRGKDEEFSFKDLEMCHRECIGGRIKQKPYCVKKITGSSQYVKDEGFGFLKSAEEDGGTIRNFWELTCQRCNASVEIEVEPEFKSVEVIATAIDGKGRGFDGKVGNITVDIHVIQKT